MSLAVWLPLNGNLTNQGLEEAIIDSGTPGYTNGGKVLGKYMNSGNLTFTVPSITGTKECTFMFWAYVVSANVVSDWTRIASFGEQGENAGSSMRFEVCPKTKYNGIYCFSNHNNTLYGLTTGCIVSPTGGYYDQWVHFAFTSDGTKFRRYMNGTDIGNCNYDGKALLNGKFFLGDGSVCYKSDVRVYNNCLSAKEIREISRGMVCHYPLNDIACTASVNKYYGDFAEGKCSHGSFTVTKLDDERGYNYKLSYTGNGGNNWHSFGFPTIPFTVGKTYDYSCKIRCRTNDCGLTMRASRCCNDWSTNMAYVNPNGVWTEYHIRQTMTGETFLRSGTTDTPKTAPELEFYTNAMESNAQVYTFDADIKDVQISECDTSAPFMTGSFVDTTVYDTSGFGNHGSVSTVKPSYSSDSPRYDGCTVFNGSSTFITTPKSVKVTDEITASIWGYCTSWSNANSRLFSCTEGGGWNIENTTDGHVNFPVYAGGSYHNCTGSILWSSLSSGWHHFAVTYNGLKSCIYIDGKLDTTSTWFTTKTPITYNTNNTVFLGAEAANSVSTPAGTYFNGKLSDFRLYATALSADAIKQLYNSPTSVTNTGVLMTQGEFKEE